MRFGDNMRDVAVTEGDKIEAQLKFGWQVNTWAVGDLVAEMATVTEEEVKAQMAAYLEKYDLATENREAVAYQAREEIAIKRMLDREGCRAFADTFQDLYGLEQLPGLAAQDLMVQGYGFGGEGDWKVSALLAVMKAMGKDETALPLLWRTTPIIWSRAESIRWVHICWRSAPAWPREGPGSKHILWALA